MRKLYFLFFLSAFFFKLDLLAQCTLYGIAETEDSIELWEYDETTFNEIRMISDDGGLYTFDH
ncbi:MAG: hypothetical protein ACK4ND_04895, partial [Cytophagaceae bacterium]